METYTFIFKMTINYAFMSAISSHSSMAETLCKIEYIYIYILGKSREKQTNIYGLNPRFNHTSVEKVVRV
jgi:hypothetical protein